MSPTTLPRADMQWAIASTTLTTVTLDIANGLQPQDGGHVLQAFIADNGQTATGSQVIGAQVVITFADVPTGAFDLFIPGNDPAIRNSAGGYLVQGDAVGNTPAARPDVEITPVGGTLVAAATAKDGISPGAFSIPPSAPTTWQYAVMVNTAPGNTAVISADGQPNFLTITAGHSYILSWSAGVWSGYQIN